MLGLTVGLLVSACGSSDFHATPLRRNGPLYLLRLGPTKEGVYRRDPNGRFTRLTFSYHDRTLSVSRKGKRISFIRTHHLYVMRPDGSHKTRLDLWPFGGISWNPDERQFVYSDVTGLWTRNLAGNGKRQLTRATHAADQSPDWSPDGKTIVFSRVGRRDALFTVRSDGGGLRKLLTSPRSSSGGASFHLYEVARPTWSPDGTKIAYLQTDLGKVMDRFSSAIEVVDRNGNDRREIAKIGGSQSTFTWSPDGKWIVYYDDRRFPTGPRSHFAGEWIVPSDGGSVRQLIPGPWYAEPHWAPAG